MSAGRGYAGRVDEAAVERDVRALAAPLHRAAESSNLGIGCSLLLLAPAPFLVFWLGLRLDLWKILLFGVLSWLPLILIVLGVSELFNRGVVRRAAAAFERRFPVGSPERLAALRIFSEMRGTDASDTTFPELTAKVVDRIEPGHALVRLTSSSPEPGLPRFLIDEPAERPAPAEEPPRPPAVYDYIPLEPLARPDDEGGEERLRSGDR